MNYWLKKVVLGILLASISAGPAWAQGRIATIDLNKVFENYWKTKQAQTVLKDRQTDMEKELKNMVDDQKKAKESYDKLVADANDPAVSSEERDKRKTAAQDKLKYLKEQEDTINQYGRQARVTLEEQSRRMRENILTDIRALVEGKAKSASYSLVIDTSAESASRTPIVLFNNNENDITQEILKQLNATAPADVSSAPASGEKKEEGAPKKDEKKK